MATEGRRRSAWSIRTVIALAVALGVALSSAAACWGQFDSLRSEHAAEVMGELDRLCKLTALALREPMWQFTADQGVSIVDAAMVNPEVVSVSASDDKGREFASKDRVAAIEDESIVQTEPVTRGGARIGSVTIKMSTLGYQRKAQKALYQALRSWAVLTAGSLAIILLILQRRIVLPAQRMEEASGRLAKGILDEPIEPAYDDELGSLARSLEATRASLLGLFAKLEASNEELREANGSLEKSAQERAQALKEALGTLGKAQEEIMQAEKLASLGRVVSGIAHELNTPIGNALLVASTLANSLGALHAEFDSGSIRKSTLQKLIRESESGVDIFLANLQKAAKLVASFKQVAVDQTSDQRRAFDLGTVTSEIMDMLNPSVRQSGAEVSIDAPQGLGFDSFPGAYGQVLSNLVMNALLHGFEGRSDGKISIVAKAGAPGRAVVEVSDNGHGMTPDVLRRIYDPFFTTKVGSGGTGLGMNIVQNIVARVLGGSIDIQSEPGKGTKVTLDLPRKAPSIAPAA